MACAKQNPNLLATLRNCSHVSDILYEWCISTTYNTEWIYDIYLYIVYLQCNVCKHWCYRISDNMYIATICSGGTCADTMASQRLREHFVWSTGIMRQ